MRITVNGDETDVQATLLNDVLRECGYMHDRIATAINGDFVHTSARAQTRLQEGDRLEVVAPMSGG
ncbi:MAG: sulfur carrier protein ThiS [Pseudomonadota bacterium]